MTAPGQAGVRTGVTRNDLLEIAGYALTAPTTHNTVPERFHLRPEAASLDVLLDRRAVLPASDPTGRQATISMGCVLAAAEVAARALGWGCAIDVPVDEEPDLTPLAIPGGTTPATAADAAVMPVAAYAPVCRLILKGLTPITAPTVLAQLRDRRVLRCEYDQSLLPPGTAEEMLRIVAAMYPALETHILDDEARLHAFAKYQEDADRFVLEREDFTRELGEWLLPNADTTTPVGMRGAELGLDAAVTHRLRDGMRRHGTLLPDETAAMAAVAKMGFKSSSAVVILASPTDTFASRVAAGRAYLHLALALHQRGLVTAMHAAVTEVRHVGRIATSTLLHTRARPLVVFRVGRPARPEDLERRRSTRPALVDVLVD